MAKHNTWVPFAKPKPGETHITAVPKELDKGFWFYKCEDGKVWNQISPKEFAALSEQMVYETEGLCFVCGPRGWILGQNTETATFEFQRCDECKKYKDDYEAGLAASKEVCTRPV